MEAHPAAPWGLRRAGESNVRAPQEHLLAADHARRPVRVWGHRADANGHDHRVLPLIGLLRAATSGAGSAASKLELKPTGEIRARPTEGSQATGRHECMSLRDSAALRRADRACEPKKDRRRACHSLRDAARAHGQRFRRQPRLGGGVRRRHAGAGSPRRGRTGARGAARALSDEADCPCVSSSSMALCAGAARGPSVRWKARLLRDERWRRRPGRMRCEEDIEVAIARCSSWASKPDAEAAGSGALPSGQRMTRKEEAIHRRHHRTSSHSVRTFRTRRVRAHRAPRRGAWDANNNTRAVPPRVAR